MYLEYIHASKKLYTKGYRSSVGGLGEKNGVYLSRERSGEKPSTYPPTAAMTWKLESQGREPGGQWQVLDSSVESKKKWKAREN